MASNRIVHVLIRGRVHGVGFRAFVRHHAELGGLEGWVRNRRDGTVEAVFSGDEDGVAAMLRICRDGPPRARVEGIETAEGDRAAIPQPGSGRFEVLATV